MKYFLIIGIAASSFFACSTPAEETKSEKQSTQLEDSILSKAMRRGDVATALVSMNTILEKDTSRTGLYDTLFQIYLEMENVQGLSEIGQILLETKPNDLAILEATSAGLTSTMQLDKALELENRMFAITGDPRLKIRIASLLFELKQVDAARKEIQWVVDHREVSDTMTAEQPSPSYQNRTQKINLRAIALYSLADLEMRLGNKKAAIGYLNRALDAEPKYDLAATTLLQIDN